MELAVDTQVRLRKLDEQLIDLLEQRVGLCSESEENGEETMDFWIEHAIDREMDELRVEKICRTVMGFCRASREP